MNDTSHVLYRVETDIYFLPRRESAVLL